MLPQLALVGRPNVGKSTLFNRLTGTREALVAGVPGLTRDRRYGRAALDGKPCILIDTGGLLGEDPLAELAGRQADLAVSEADAVLFLVDARAGLTGDDQAIAKRLRKTGRPVLLVVNKVDGLNPLAAQAEFAPLGFADQRAVSASQGRGLAVLRAKLAQRLPDAPDLAEDETDAIRAALIGRPNVGKSTLINQLLGEERQLVFDQPGTTRDAIEVPFARGGDRFLLIDTAGVRRKGRVDGVAEKFSVVKALQAMERAQVVVLVIDGWEGLVDQDLHVLQHALNAGCGLVVAVNKWDALDAGQRKLRWTALQRRLAFAPWAPVRAISALRGEGLGRLMADLKAVHRAGALPAGAALLNRILQSLQQAHPPPAAHGRPIKLRYAHKTGQHPPRILVHGNQTEALPASYIRYLENGFREALNLIGTPVQLQFRTSRNPYAGQRNSLTRRQRRRRQRVMRHGKR